MTLNKNRAIAGARKKPRAGGFSRNRGGGASRQRDRAVRKDTAAPELLPAIAGSDNKEEQADLFWLDVDKALFGPVPDILRDALEQHIQYGHEFLKAYRGSSSLITRPREQLVTTEMHDDNLITSSLQKQSVFQTVTKTKSLYDPTNTTRESAIHGALLIMPEKSQFEKPEHVEANSVILHRESNLAKNSFFVGPWEFFAAQVQMSKLIGSSIESPSFPDLHQESNGGQSSMFGFLNLDVVVCSLLGIPLMDNINVQTRTLVQRLGGCTHQQQKVGDKAPESSVVAHTRSSETCGESTKEKALGLVTKAFGISRSYPASMIVAFLRAVFAEVKAKDQHQSTHQLAPIMSSHGNPDGIRAVVSFPPSGYKLNSYPSYLAEQLNSAFSWPEFLQILLNIHIRNRLIQINTPQRSISSQGITSSHKSDSFRRGAQIQSHHNDFRTNIDNPQAVQSFGMPNYVIGPQAVWQNHMVQKSNDQKKSDSIKTDTNARMLQTSSPYLLASNSYWSMTASPEARQVTAIEGIEVKSNPLLVFQSPRKYRRVLLSTKTCDHETESFAVNMSDQKDSHEETNFADSINSTPLVEESPPLLVNDNMLSNNYELCGGNSTPEAYDVFPQKKNNLNTQKEFLLNELNSIVEAKCALLENLTREFKHRTSLINESFWKSIESQMVDLYRKEFFSQSLSGRHLYTLARQYRDLYLVRMMYATANELPGWWTEQALCSVCGSGLTYDEDPIIFCDACYLPAHHGCVGYPTVSVVSADIPTFSPPSLPPSFKESTTTTTVTVPSRNTSFIVNNQAKSTQPEDIKKTTHEKYFGNKAPNLSPDQVEETFIKDRHVSGSRRAQRLRNKEIRNAAATAPLVVTRNKSEARDTDDDESDNDEIHDEEEAFEDDDADEADDADGEDEDGEEDVTDDPEAADESADEKTPAEENVSPYLEKSRTTSSCAQWGDSEDFDYTTEVGTVERGLNTHAGGTGEGSDVREGDETMALFPANEMQKEQAPIVRDASRIRGMKRLGRSHQRNVYNHGASDLSHDGSATAGDSSGYGGELRKLNGTGHASLAVNSAKIVNGRQQQQQESVNISSVPQVTEEEWYCDSCHLVIHQLGDLATAIPVIRHLSGPRTPKDFADVISDEKSKDLSHPLCWFLPTLLDQSYQPVLTQEFFKKAPKLPCFVTRCQNSSQKMHSTNDPDKSMATLIDNEGISEKTHIRRKRSRSSSSSKSQSSATSKSSAQEEERGGRSDSPIICDSSRLETVSGCGQADVTPKENHDNEEFLVKPINSSQPVSQDFGSTTETTTPPTSSLFIRPSGRRRGRPRLNRPGPTRSGRQSVSNTPVTPILTSTIQQRVSSKHNNISSSSPPPPVPPTSIINESDRSHSQQPDSRAPNQVNSRKQFLSKLHTRSPIHWYFWKVTVDQSEIDNCRNNLLLKGTSSAIRRRPRTRVKLKPGMENLSSVDNKIISEKIKTEEIVTNNLRQNDTNDFIVNSQLNLNSLDLSENNNKNYYHEWRIAAYPNFSPINESLLNYIKRYDEADGFYVQHSLKEEEDEKKKRNSDVVTETLSSNKQIREFYISIPCCSICGYDPYFKGGGVIKKGISSRKRREFAHIRCALSIDGIVTPEALRYSVEPERSKLRCNYCNQYGPAPIQCGHAQCPRPYHVPCATQSRDCVTEFSEARPIVYCIIHSKEKPPTQALRLYQLSQEKQKRLRKRLEEELCIITNNESIENRTLLSSWWLRSLFYIHNLTARSLDFIFPPKLSLLLNNNLSDSINKSKNQFEARLETKSGVNYTKNVANINITKEESMNLNVLKDKNEITTTLSKKKFKNYSKSSFSSSVLSRFFYDNESIIEEDINNYKFMNNNNNTLFEVKENSQITDIDFSLYGINTAMPCSTIDEDLWSASGMCCGSYALTQNTNTNSSNISSQILNRGGGGLSSGIIEKGGSLNGSAGGLGGVIGGGGGGGGLGVGGLIGSSSTLNTTISPIQQQSTIMIDSAESIKQITKEDVKASASYKLYQGRIGALGFNNLQDIAIRLYVYTNGLPPSKKDINELESTILMVLKSWDNGYLAWLKYMPRNNTYKKYNSKIIKETEAPIYASKNIEEVFEEWSCCSCAREGQLLSEANISIENEKIFLESLLQTPNIIPSILMRCSCCGCCICSVCCYSYCPSMHSSSEWMPTTIISSSSSSSSLKTASNSEGREPDGIEQANNTNRTVLLAADSATDLRTTTSSRDDSPQPSSTTTTTTTTTINKEYISGGGGSLEQFSSFYKKSRGSLGGRFGSGTRTSAGILSHIMAEINSGVETQKLYDMITSIVTKRDCYIICPRCEYFFGGRGLNQKPIATAHKLYMEHPSLYSCCILCNRSDGFLVIREGSSILTSSTTTTTDHSSSMILPSTTTGGGGELNNINTHLGSSARVGGGGGGVSSHIGYHQSSINLAPSGLINGNNNILTPSEKFDQSAGPHWVHPACAEWFIPPKLKGSGVRHVGRILKKYDCRPGDWIDTSIVASTFGASREEGNLSCTICGLSTGALWICSFPKCSQGFHVSCSRLWGCKFDQQYRRPGSMSGPNSNVSLLGIPGGSTRRAYCLEHSFTLNQQAQMWGKEYETGNTWLTNLAVAASCWSSSLQKIFWNIADQKTTNIMDLSIHLIQTYLFGVGCLPLVFPTGIPSWSTTDLQWSISRPSLGLILPPRLIQIYLEQAQLMNSNANIKNIRDLEQLTLSSPSTKYSSPKAGRSTVDYTISSSTMYPDENNPSSGSPICTGTRSTMNQPLVNIQASLLEEILKAERRIGRIDQFKDANNDYSAETGDTTIDSYSSIRPPISSLSSQWIESTIVISENVAPSKKKEYEAFSYKKEDKNDTSSEDADTIEQKNNNNEEEDEENLLSPCSPITEDDLAATAADERDTWNKENMRRVLQPSETPTSFMFSGGRSQSGINARGIRGMRRFGVIRPSDLSRASDLPRRRQSITLGRSRRSQGKSEFTIFDDDFYDEEDTDEDYEGAEASQRRIASAALDLNLQHTLIQPKKPPRRRTRLAPGEPPRRRGRPRKYPLPEPKEPRSETISLTGPSGGVITSTSHIGSHHESAGGGRQDTIPYGGIDENDAATAAIFQQHQIYGMHPRLSQQQQQQQMYLYGQPQFSLRAMRQIQQQRQLQQQQLSFLPFSNISTQYRAFPGQTALAAGYSPYLVHGHMMGYAPQQPGQAPPPYYIGGTMGAPPNSYGYSSEPSQQAGGGMSLTSGQLYWPPTGNTNVGTLNSPHFTMMGLGGNQTMHANAGTGGLNQSSMGIPTIPSSPRSFATPSPMAAASHARLVGMGPRSNIPQQQQQHYSRHQLGAQQHYMTGQPQSATNTNNSLSNVSAANNVISGAPLTTTTTTTTSSDSAACAGSTLVGGTPTSFTTVPQPYYFSNASQGNDMTNQNHTTPPGWMIPGPWMIGGNTPNTLNR